MDYWIIWLVIVFLLTIVELATINLVSVWFVISGCLALIVSLFTQNFYIQFGVFVICGIVFLVLTKPFLNKLKREKEENLYRERIPGMEGIVTVAIKKGKIGEVKVDGKLWSATADEDIERENLIKVLEVDGIKLVVKNNETVLEKKEKIDNTALPKKKNNQKSKSKETTKKEASKKKNTKKGSKK